MTPRLIARLDIKGPDLVKGIHLEGLRALGSPRAFARHYYDAGVDELIYQDIVASLYQRNSLHGFIRATASDAFIPLTVGGGLRSIEDIRGVLRAGADKATLNTAAIARPGLIEEASRVFGSSTIVVAIEAIRQPDGRYLASTDCGREMSDREVIAWAREAARLGAGEILLTSVDREGTGHGFDLELVAAVSSAVSIPVIAHGGAGNTAHIVDVLTKGTADAVAVASMLHYSSLTTLDASARGAVTGNQEFLHRGAQHPRFQGNTVASIKASLTEAGIHTRPPFGVVA